jgi:hypothetical protein
MSLVLPSSDKIRELPELDPQLGNTSDIQNHKVAGEIRRPFFVRHK